ncbi:hypothetical protein [Aeromonas sp. 602293]|uniref:hypothetical protein n=1 Tax=Aeromonas sp. 602293 TaxID=2712041 RepID=UPI003BA33C06
MKNFTVIGIYTDNGQVFANTEVAESGDKAILASAAALNAAGADAEIVVAIEGEHFEGQSLSFAGECAVDIRAILECA